MSLRRREPPAPAIRSVMSSTSLSLRGNLEVEGLFVRKLGDPRDRSKLANKVSRQNKYRNVQVLDSYRVGSDRIANNNPGVNCNPAFSQIGTEPNDRLGITGFQNTYCKAQVCDSYRVGSDLITYNYIGLGDPSVNHNPLSNQIDTEPNDGLGITGYPVNYHTV